MGNEEKQALRDSIEQYELQLNQVKSALSAIPKPSGPEKESLLALQRDIEELIQLTRENLLRLEKQPSGSKDVGEPNDPFEDEYALFKAELEDLESDDSKTKGENQTKIELSAEMKKELAALQGTKCQAPYKNQSELEPSYHNALIMGVEDSRTASSIHQIMVRVLFVNPTQHDMIPCPYFLEGGCRFSDERCRFSHGQLVTFGELKEFREPDFSSVRIGTKVLAKQKDSLWHRAVIIEVLSNVQCRVKFCTSGVDTEDIGFRGNKGQGIEDIDLHDLLPLSENSSGSDSKDDDSDGSSDSSDSDDMAGDKDEDHKALVELSLLRAPASTALGSWEKHTKGVGSRLMEKMGYVQGTGLGRNGEGILEPVDAVIYPPGKSLDHCMELREAAGGDKDMFKAEKRRLRIQLREEKKREREYEKEKQRTDVFSFINSSLAGTSKNEGNNTTTPLSQASRRQLNIESFQIGENIKKAEKEMVKLKESLTRQESGSTLHKTIAGRVTEVENEILRLQGSQKTIASQQKQRENRKKLAIF